MTKKFIQGKNAGRMNSIIDDVSMLKSKHSSGEANQSFGVVRCFRLMDTSVAPMVATGVLWDSVTEDWIQSGLGDAVEVYPSPDYEVSSYADESYVFARNFGGRWFVVGGSGGDRWAFCKVAAGTGSTLVCYLDTDSGEEADEITVNFELLNCSNLNDGHLTLVDGSRIRVAKDGDDWWCVTPIEGSEDCE